MKTQDKTRTGIRRHSLKAVAAVALAAVALVALPAVALAAPGPSVAPDPGATPATVQTAPSVDRHAIVEAGSDVYLAPGQVADTIVVLDGDVVVAGTVRHAVVVFGGDVTVRDGARIGTESRRGETSLVVAGGAATVAPGADVNGKVHTLRHVSAGDAVVLGGLAGLGLGVAAVTAIGIALIALFAAPAVIAAIVVLVVWLARRDRRTPVQPPMTPTAGPGTI